MSFEPVSVVKRLAATGLALVALSAGPLQAEPKGSTPAVPVTPAAPTDPGTARELERAREEVEKAREDLRRATRALARSMAKAEKDTPRGEYFNFIANPRRAMLGVIIGDEKDDGVEHGVAVLAVTPGSGAEKAGLKAGDVITTVNGKSLAAGEGKHRPHRKMREVMRELSAGDEARLDYERDGKRSSTKVITQAPEPDLALSLPMLPHWVEGMRDLEHVEGLPPLANMFQYRGAAIRGLELAKLDEDLGHYFKTREGVLVIKAPKSGALSLKSGDVIQKIDGDAVTEPVTVLDKLRSRNAEQDVKLEVLRQGRKVQIEGKIPVALADHRRGERRKHVKVVGADDDDN